MNKNVVVLFFLFFTIFLSACSLEPDVAQKYKQEKPLVADIVIPETFSFTDSSTFKVVLHQDGAVVNGADFVHFEMWNHDGSVNYGMEEVVEVGDGIYQISKAIKSDGLYYIMVHAGNNGSIIMPRKQFVVGELSESELEFLQNGTQMKEQSNGDHH
ncbi:FixH family protein [Litchfieldia alkalitelluris]|uniref:FixH family protein n=1 Tax=Litchfieldia alkalitelluris TaxID=304268 RepID=UPI0009988F3C|nr:FixH family protein [Litchfieldia alkalitelluris]